MDRKYAKFLLQKTRKDFDLIAPDFSRTRWSIWAEFENFREYLKDGDKVLDAGCGNGRLLDLFKDKNIDYVGLDFSKGLIEIARKKHSQHRFVVGDVLDLPFSNDSFNIVFSVAVLHHIPSKEFRQKVLKEARRVLKPGGTLILTVWDVWGKKKAWFNVLKHSFLKILGQSKLDFLDVFVPWGDKALRYYHYFTKTELVNLVKEAGFKIEDSGVARNERGTRSNIYVVAVPLRSP